MTAELVFYVSGHGFGHATRIAALIRALADAVDPPTLAVRTEAPHWIFTARTPDVQCSTAAIDVGVLQPNGLDVDLPGTLAAHERFCSTWDAAVAREAAWIRASGARLVVADVPALAFAAAQRAGVRAVGVANFSWDWILGTWAAADPRWSPLAARYRAAYASAERLFRLPLCADLSAFTCVVDAPLLVNRAHRTQAECRALARIAPGEGRHVVLFSFGGMGSGALEAGGSDPALDGYLFVGIGPKPRGFPGAWHALPDANALPHEELIRACDAVLGKPGFSTVAEVLAHERRMLYLSRPDFPENAALELGLQTSGRALPMPRADFAAGRWREYLDALFALPPPPPAPAADGAEVIAAALLGLL